MHLGNLRSIPRRNILVKFCSSFEKATHVFYLGSTNTGNIFIVAYFITKHLLINNCISFSINNTLTTNLCIWTNNSYFIIIQENRSITNRYYQGTCNNLCNRRNCRCGLCSWYSWISYF